MYDVYVGMHGCSIAQMWRSEGHTVGWFSPTIMWLPGIEFKLSSLCVTHLYLLSHLSGSIYSFFLYMGFHLSQHHLS